MPMNRFHQWCCRSASWARKVERELLPWALDGVDLGPDVLEIGPGYGATTRVLRRRVPGLTALEIDPALAGRLRGLAGSSARIVDGDGTAMPFEEAGFSGAVCFTMLHHVPSPREQDRLFAEACRVLRPGGVFAGSDGLDGRAFRLIHLFDTCVIVDPDTLPGRLEAAGFTDVAIELGTGSFRFSARKP
ncbi:class I SAM-dependent methyltransferase [Actinomadura sp. NEAU-AAG7]|uniref:class I SAM-dependent methyltransferase n=1 Tax=Actinomadura sp. NEAU-AAG7 TaxID=2839640 RepID=UPI001BE4DB60|nr:class I SAM-dependent methyltransferase [Actinomadura sp. NEAU-AAG7]MBT2208352.1 methyltransferase domain-containing protein [Actinomadura sp. NEAU-AAG7]